MFVSVFCSTGWTEEDRGGRAGDGRSAACVVRRLSRLAIRLRRCPQQDFHGVLQRRLLVPGSCMAGDGRWSDRPCLGSRVLVSGGSDAASLVWYDACTLGADHSCLVTRSQWKGDKYFHSLIPVSREGLGFVAGVVDLLRRRRLSCWLAGWSEEGSEYQGTSSPVFNFGRTTPAMTMLTVTSGHFRRSVSILYPEWQPRAGCDAVAACWCCVVCLSESRAPVAQYRSPYRSTVWLR